MITKNDLQDILIITLKSLGGKGTIIEVCKYVWDNYEEKLKKSGTLFYTWQYDIRWAATMLRKNKIMKSTHISPSGIWELV
jgi:hypothetical protein